MSRTQQKRFDGQRWFGSWAAALRAARLGYPIGATRLRSSRLYRQEYARQQALYRARRDAGKERKVP